MERRWQRGGEEDEAAMEDAKFADATDKDSREHNALVGERRQRERERKRQERQS